MTPRVEDRISRKGHQEYWRGRRRGANFSKDALNRLRGPKINLSQAISQTQMQHLSDQELAIIQRVAENERVFGSLFPTDQDKVLEPLTHLRENFDYEKLQNAMRDHVSQRPIVTKVGGQQGVLALHKHFASKKVGIAGLGNLVGAQTALGIEEAFEEYDDRLEEFLGSDMKEYQEAAALK